MTLATEVLISTLSRRGCATRNLLKHTRVRRRDPTPSRRAHRVGPAPAIESNGTAKLSAAASSCANEYSHPTYKRHRFPRDLIQYAVWLYFRFNISRRDIEDLLAQRGIDVSRESIRL